MQVYMKLASRHAHIQAQAQAHYAHTLKHEDMHAQDAGSFESSVRISAADIVSEICEGFGAEGWQAVLSAVMGQLEAANQARVMSPHGPCFQPLTIIFYRRSNPLNRVNRCVLLRMCSNTN
jgi:hypothetical protein